MFYVNGVKMRRWAAITNSIVMCGSAIHRLSMIEELSFVCMIDDEKVVSSQTICVSNKMQKNFYPRSISKTQIYEKKKSTTSKNTNMQF